MDEDGSPQGISDLFFDKAEMKSFPTPPIFVAKKGYRDDDASASDETDELQRLRHEKEELTRRREELRRDRRQVQWRLQRLDAEVRGRCPGHESSTKIVPEEYSEEPIPILPRSKHKLPSIVKRRPGRSDCDDAIDIESQQCHGGSSLPNPNLDEADLTGKPRLDRKRSGTVLLRKIIHAILTDLDDETLMRDDTEPVLIAITLLKEAMVGLLIAFVVVTVVLFIDHRFLLGLSTARNFRRATFHLMDNRETLRDFEEQAGLKFLEMEEWETMVEEIAKSANRTKLAATILEQRSNDLKNTLKDYDQYASMELPKLIKELGLDRHCELCVWEKGRHSMTCSLHAQAMGGTYQLPLVANILKAEKQRSCERLEDKIVEGWASGVRSDFCFECDATPQMACGNQASLLGLKHDLTPERARARVMIENEKCRLSFHERESKRLKNFCNECQWDRSMTCQQRAGLLMYMEKLSSRDALLSAMEAGKCVKRGSSDSSSLFAA